MKQEISGRRISDNTWFQVQFATVRNHSELTLTVTSENDDAEKQFSLWLDKDNQPGVTAGHDCDIVFSNNSS